MVGVEVESEAALLACVLARELSAFVPALTIDPPIGPSTPFVIAPAVDFSVSSKAILPILYHYNDLRRTETLTPATDVRVPVVTRERESPVVIVLLYTPDVLAPEIVPF